MNDHGSDDETDTGSPPPPQPVSAPTDQAPAPPYTTTAPAATATPTDPPPQARPTRTLVLAVAWIAAIAALLFVARIAWLRTTGGESYRLGYAFGTVLGPILLAFALRWLYVRFRRPGPVIRSGWVPITVMVLAAVALASTLAPRPAADPELALRVAAPYTLVEADAATIDAIGDQLSGDPSTREFVVRSVVGADGSRSVLFVVDSGLSAGDISDVARGMGESAGVPATVETIAGTEVAMAIAPTVALGSWIESPLLISVAAVDEATLRSVIEAVLAAP